MFAPFSRAKLINNKRGVFIIECWKNISISVNSTQVCLQRFSVTDEFIFLIFMLSLKTGSFHIENLLRGCSYQITSA